MIPFCFFLSAVVLWLQATVYPELPLLAFAPFLALVSLEKGVSFRPLSNALIWSAGAGFVVDLLSQDPLGLHALTYALSCGACFRWRRRCSSEAPLQFALYTGLLSATVTLVQAALLFLFDRRVPFPGTWWISEGLCLPVFDAVYALAWFAGPLALYRTLRERWRLHRLKKHEAH